MSKRERQSELSKEWVMSECERQSDGRTLGGKRGFCLAQMLEERTRSVLCLLCVLLAAASARSATTPTISVASSGSPSTYGNSVTFTATVTSGDTNTVTFYNGSTSLGTATPASGKATLATSSLPAGSDSITAKIASGGNYNSATSSAITQTVNQATPTITLTCSPNPSIFGGSVTCTATVTSGDTNTVTFYNGSTSLGTATPASGTATLATSSLPVGSDSITAKIATGGNYAANTSSAITQTVNAAAPTVTGSGAINTVPVFTGTSTIGNSPIAVSGSNVGIGTTSPTVGTLQVSVDSSSTMPSQLALTGGTNKNQQLLIGYNTSSNYGSIQAQIAGTNYMPLALQPLAGSVGIGTTSPGAYRLYVNNPSGYGMDSFATGSDTVGSRRNYVLGGGSGDWWAEGIGQSTGNFVLDYLDPNHSGAGAANYLTVATSGNIGIGTTSPAYKLDVEGGQVNASGGYCIGGSCITSWPTAGANTWTKAQTFQGITNFPSGVWNANGNVGIGTTSPTTALTVNGDFTLNPAGGIPLVITGRSAADFTGQPTLVPAGGGLGSLFIGAPDTAPVRLGNDGSGNFAVAIGQTNLYNGKLEVLGSSAIGGLTIQTGNSPQFQGPLIVMNGVGTETMVVTPAGNVGIGTTAPVGTLDIERTANDSGVILQIGNAEADAFQFSRSGTTGALSIQGNQIGYNNILLAPTTGNVGIGTTSPGSKLDVEGGQINASGGYCIGGSCITSWPTAGTNTWTGAQTFQGTTNFPSGVWNANGNVGIGTTAPSGQLANNSTNYGDFGAGLSTGSFNWLETGGGWNAISSAGSLGLVVATDQTTGTTFQVSSGPYNTGTDQRPNHLLTVLGSGNVGIGTTTPNATLEVNGTAQVDGALNVGNAGVVFPNGGGTQTTAWTGVLCGGDYAEDMRASGSKAKYEPGDVLILADGESSDVQKSTEPYSTMVAGIYASKPGVIGRRAAVAQSFNNIPMAMVGVVPTKVTAENGAIHRGDLLVTSSRPGFAMKGTDRNRMFGAVIGKAMGSLDSGTGVIEVLVTLQ